MVLTRRRFLVGLGMVAGASALPLGTLGAVDYWTTHPGPVFVLYENVRLADFDTMPLDLMDVPWTMDDMFDAMEARGTL